MPKKNDALLETSEKIKEIEGLAHHPNLKFNYMNEYTRYNNSDSLPTATDTTITSDGTSTVSFAGTISPAAVAVPSVPCPCVAIHRTRK
ncbi:hypothetical protein INT48_002478 [Thamnidium elegans]|uniref:Uncharacterized protein n=1 Tax=Thamnidium elegans TaxID=101142 RepID=A0A8H7SIV1_9FUNG|nr:hypothetical protein INT48_002478 [Thamnidium elegans]